MRMQHFTTHHWKLSLINNISFVYFASGIREEKL